MYGWCRSEFCFRYYIRYFGIDGVCGDILNCFVCVGDYYGDFFGSGSVYLS